MEEKTQETSQRRYQEEYNGSNLMKYSSDKSSKVELSVVIAAYNEEHNVSELYKKLSNAKINFKKPNKKL